MLIAERAEISAFVDSIFRYADPGTFISLRAFDQKDRGKPPVLIEAVRIGENLDDVVEAAVAAAQRAANAPSPAVFAPPVATFRDARSARAIDLANGVGISVELDSGDTRAAKARLEHLLGPSTTVMASGGQWIDPETGEVHDKLHLHWRLSEPTRTPDDHERLRLARQLAAQLVGGDPTAAPPVHPLRWPGSWNLKGSPRLAMIAGGNPAAEVHLIDALDRLQEAVELAGIAAQSDPHISGGQPVASDLARVASAMAAVPNDDLHWDQWTRFGMALYRASGGSPDGLAIWRDWSAKSAKHEDGACDERWAHFATSPPTLIGAGTIFFHAGQAGWTWQPEPPPDPDDPGYWGSLEADAQLWRDIEARETGAAQPATDAAKKVAGENLLWAVSEGWSEASIPPRPWVVPGYFLRGAVTVLSGPPSAGKSSIVVATTACCAVGCAYGRFRPPGQLRVLNYNVEDDESEQRRRYSAMWRRLGVQSTAWEGYLRLVGPTRVGTLLTFGRDGGVLLNTPVMDALEKMIEEFSPDLVVLDPFVELHTAEENDNTAVRYVMARLRAIAVERQCAVCVLHHARKGNLTPGDPDTLRGASAIVGAARIAITVLGMSEEDAKQLGMPIEHRRRYLRLDSAKTNYAPVTEAEWYERVEYQLDNGDGVVAVQPWRPPSVMAELTAPTINAILDRIGAGYAPGILYRADQRGGASPRWAGNVLVDNGVEEARAKHILGLWLKNGLLVETDYRDQTEGKTRRGVTVDNTKRP